MRKLCLVLVSAVSVCVGSAHAQVFRARSADYLFGSSANDARAIWLNPAGLAAVPEASILGDLVFARPDTGSLRVSQWSVGFNSRGFALAYLRDRLPTGTANEAIRFGVARGLPRWSLGISATLYRSDETQRGVDIGFRGRPLGSVDVGLAILNIGQPQIRGVTVPAVGLGSATWYGLAGLVQVSGELAATNRLASSGYDMSYRIGGRLTVPAPLPAAAFTALDFDQDVGIARWSVGLAVGGDQRVILVGSGVTGIPSRDLDFFSVSAMAFNRLTATHR